VAVALAALISGCAAQGPLPPPFPPMWSRIAGPGDRTQMARDSERCAGIAEIPWAQGRPGGLLALMSVNVATLSDGDRRALLQARDVFARCMTAAGYRPLTADEIQEAARHGTGDLDCGGGEEDLAQYHPVAAVPMKQQVHYRMSQQLTALNVRRIDAEAAARIRRAARARGLTIGAYLARLVELHQAACAMADGRKKALDALLKRLGLETVRT
jgi:hypothetical protein